MLPSKPSLVLILCVVVLGAGCGDKTPTPRIPSDLSLWKQVEIPEPPEIATIPVEDSSQIRFLLWSPDDRQLAYVTESEDGAVVHVYDVETGETRQIVPGGQVYEAATTWDPSGQRFLVGTFVNAPAPVPITPRVRRRGLLGGHDVPSLPSTITPEHAESLKEYDVASGTLLRLLTVEDLGGVSDRAVYSPDGSELLVIARNPPGSSISWRTLLVASDGSVETIASERKGQRRPQWCSDGNGFVYMQRAQLDRKIFGFKIGTDLFVELRYQPSGTDGISRVLDATEPFGTIGAKANYPNDGGLIRYRKWRPNESGDVDQSELWEYRFSTQTPQLILDLKTLFDQVCDDAPLHRVQCILPTDPGWCLARTRPKPKQPWDCWYVSLNSDRTVGQLPLDFSSMKAWEISPSGHRVAYVDDEPAIHILDLGAVLPRSGSGQKGDD